MKPLEHVQAVPGPGAAFPSVAAQGMMPLEQVPDVPGASGAAFPSVAAQGMMPLEHVQGVPGPGAAFSSDRSSGYESLGACPRRARSNNLPSARLRCGAGPDGIPRCKTV